MQVNNILQWIQMRKITYYYYNYLITLITINATALWSIFRSMLKIIRITMELLFLVWIVGKVDLSETLTKYSMS